MSTKLLEEAKGTVKKEDSIVKAKGHSDDNGHPPGFGRDTLSDPQFVNKLDPKNDICCVCKHVLQDSIQTACGHRVCERHINERLEKGEIYTCPGGDPDCVEINNENRQLLAFPDYFARKHISTLLVYCPNKDHGCKEQIPWKLLQEHTAKCNFIKIKCRNEGCDELVLANHMAEHMKNECVFRIEDCPKCHNPTPHALMNEHLLNYCDEEIIKCPYKCGEEFKRKDREGHERACASKPKACELSSLGCDFKGSEEDVQRHESLDNIEHLGLFAIKLENQSLESKKLERRLEQMQNEKQIYEKEMKDLAEHMGKLVKQYSDMNHKVQNISKAMANHGEKVISLEDKYTSFKSETESLRMDSVNNMEKRLLALERKEDRSYTTGGEEGASKDVVDGLKTQVRQLDRMVGLHDVRLAEVDLRMDCNDITSYDGHIIWKITGIEQRKRDAVNRKTLSLYSPPFYTSKYGYKMCGRIYLNGDGIGKGTHVSLFFVLMKGEYDNVLEFPFRQKVSFMIYDQSPERRHLQDSFYPDPSSTSFKKPTANMNVASGCPLFVRQDVLENQGYLKDDCIYIKVAADVNDPPLVPL